MSLSKKAHESVEQWAKRDLIAMNRSAHRRSDDSYHSRMAPVETARPIESNPLVTTPISHRHPEDEVHFFPVSFRVKKYNSGKKDNIAPDRTSTTISGFSSKSRSRLRFTAVNSPQKFISQFGLTYHNEWSTDGRECKKHLDTWLKTVRRIYPDISYLWIMEFQTRNAPHFHIFFDVPPDETNRKKLAEAWCRITSPDDDQALKFHTHAKNWIDWDMGSAQYLAKYLDKESQKHIPEGYKNFGRFWGNSRNAKPIELPMDLEELEELSVANKETGEIYGGKTTILRWLGRLAEKQTNGYSKFRKRVAHGSYTMLQGAKAYAQIEDYFSKLQRRDIPF